MLNDRQLYSVKQLLDFFKNMPILRERDSKLTSNQRRIDVSRGVETTSIRHHFAHRGNVEPTSGTPFKTNGKSTLLVCLPNVETMLILGWLKRRHRINTYST